MLYVNAELSGFHISTVKFLRWKVFKARVLIGFKKKKPVIIVYVPSFFKDHMLAKHTRGGKKPGRY